LGSVLGKVVLFGLTVSLFYHLAAGVRHLFWDSGVGFLPKTADMTGMMAIAFGIAAAVAVWVLAAMMGAL
jgi:succinate dehydrogenase / fumarate reductase cytochrome b subunit